MYDAVADSYCYPGTSVLKNLSNLRKLEIGQVGKFLYSEVGDADQD